jgi:hypothetical protein
MALTLLYCAALSAQQRTITPQAANRHWWAAFPIWRAVCRSPNPAVYIGMAQPTGTGQTVALESPARTAGDSGHWVFGILGVRSRLSISVASCHWRGPVVASSLCLVSVYLSLARYLEGVW